MDLVTLSIALLIAFVIFGSVDGFFLHIWRFRLHARPETRAEHLIHSMRALLFIPTLALIMAGDTSGWLLWTGVAVVVIDTILTVADVLTESDSRDFQGGLPGYEFRLHMLLSLLHLGAIAASLAARPTAAWFGTIPADPAAAWASQLVWLGLVPGAGIAAAIHFALYFWGAEIEAIRPKRLAAFPACCAPLPV